MSSEIHEAPEPRIVSVIAVAWSAITVAGLISHLILTALRHNGMSVADGLAAVIIIACIAVSVYFFMKIMDTITNSKWWL